ncbi:hypothetical protein BD414DRAFT_59140 [Trametes punicea]|nr:hypothetical protein BD414DRAFT_59140 [Trametes punicea]
MSRPVGIGQTANRHPTVKKQLETGNTCGGGRGGRQRQRALSGFDLRAVYSSSLSITTPSRGVHILIETTSRDTGRRRTVWRESHGSTHCSYAAPPPRCRTRSIAVVHPQENQGGSAECRNSLWRPGREKADQCFAAASPVRVGSLGGKDDNGDLGWNRQTRGEAKDGPGATIRTRRMGG